MRALVWLWVLMAAPVGWAQDIHLKSRTIGAAAQGRPGTPGVPGHLIVQFDHPPGAADLAGLLTDGYSIVSVLPDDSVVVATPDGSAPGRAGVRWTGTLDAADKLSPSLPGGDTILAIIEFHPDVSSDVQDGVAQAEGLTLERAAPLAANHAIVQASMGQLRALAQHDEVAYIFPADPALPTDSGFNTCAGMLTASGPIPQFANIVHGWDADAGGIVHLGYFFGSLTPKVPAATVQSEIVRALNEWSKYANVVFQPAAGASSSRTVAIKFASGAHGDAYPFDGPGGILAHTFYPVPLNPESLAGDMHLDADENWHAGDDVDIYSVALHEAGHAIGLGHSDKPGDVMYPYYRSGMHLSANDIGAAQALYGAPASVSAAAPVTAGPTPAAPAALHLAIDPAGAATGSSQLSLAGVITGGVPPISVEWQTDHGYSGQAAAAGSGWLASSIPLVNGENAISVTAFDSARRTSTQTVNVVLTPPAAAAPATGGGVPVSIVITSPASAVTTTSGPTLTLAGKASGGQGIVRIAWQTSGGATGTATGTSAWLASGVPLLPGTNTVIVKAYDAKGNSGWATMVAVRH